MILETNGPLIAEKVTSHSLDADAPLSEQVMQLCFGLASILNVLFLLNCTTQMHKICHIDRRWLGYSPKLHYLLIAIFL